MKTYCEIAVSSVLPAVRSIITKELMEKYNMTQEEVAELLGITQPAVSQYKKEVRGVKVRMLERNQDVMKIIDEIVRMILDKEITEREINKKICSACRKVKEMLEKKCDLSCNCLVEEI